jgi:hypothetical protein
MSKLAKQQLTAVPAATTPVSKATRHPAIDPKPKRPDRVSKQSQVIAMLRSPAGATIGAMMKATGWQQHSVRGFLAGIVRKRLKLKLDSKLVDNKRVYRVASESNASFGISQAKRAKG